MKSSSEIQPSIEAIFQVRIINHYSDTVYQGPVFRNTVLDSGLDQLATHTLEDLISVVNIGTGRQHPTPADTELEEYLLSSSSMNTEWESTYEYEDPAHLAMKGIFSFGVNSFKGEVSEVGLSRANNVGYLNRQLIRNILGAPITIQVIEGDELQIACWVYAYSDKQTDSPAEEVEFSFNGDIITAVKEFNVANIGADSMKQFTGNVGNTKCQLSSDTGISFNCSGTLDIEIAKEYESRSFTQRYKAASTPEYREINMIYLGWGTGDNWIANVVYQLAETIIVPATDSFTFEFERSWGRYEA